MIVFRDTATIKGGTGTITPEGYFVADALVARANNIQEYRARELGLTDRQPDDLVRVFRPEAEVFAVDSLATAAHIPITLDHPPVMVDAQNVLEYRRGGTGGQVLRDGEFMRIPLRIEDAGAVTSVRTERKEFSLGYAADLKLEAGVFDGQAYDASVTNIRYNHLAACRAARGGPELRIIDERSVFNDTVAGAKKWLLKAIALHEKHMEGKAPTTGVAGEASQKLMMTQMQNALSEITGSAPDRTPKMKMGDNLMPHIVVVDGLPVDVSNPESAAAVVKAAITARDTANGALEASQTALTTANNTIAARDGEIVTLKDSLEKAKLSPQALRDAAGDYARVSATAKALGATITDAMDAQQIRDAAVAHKLPGKTYATDAERNAVFDVLAAAVKPTGLTDAAPDPLRALLADGQPTTLGDAQSKADQARNARFARFANAHTGATAGAAH
jgi:hypothetical protein